MNVTKQLGSYVYVQYNEDNDIQAFCSAYNNLSQQNLDYINSLQLPIYSDQSGTLLDWAATGIYGIPRQSLSSGGPHPVGPLNTYPLNSERMNDFSLVSSPDTFQTTDLIYQRIIQWNTFKGDGYQFSVRWIKRRVQRFLTGRLYPDQTYQISVIFTGDDAVLITIHSAVRYMVDGVWLNSKDWNALGKTFNEGDTIAVVYTPTELAASLRSAIFSNVLLLPFQYTFTVDIA